MSSIQERLQLKRVPLDTWNVREQLCLASAVVRSGDQNWMSVSRALKTVGDPTRPADWYSQKSCAAQYGALLEHVETPKRKKRNSEGAGETPQESILKRLTQERIAEIQKSVAEMNQQYLNLKKDISEISKWSTSEDRLQEMWSAVEAASREQEREAARRAAAARERDERRAQMERNARASSVPQNSGGAPSSPLLTSLLKSSPVVTTPQHISHPANSVDAVSPSANAPTLSQLLEPRREKHAAIEHIKSQLVQIEQQLKANPTPPPAPPLAPPEPPPALDIDDIEIKAEDVYAFRDVDIDIPPVGAMHKAVNNRVPEKPLECKTDEHELPSEEPMETSLIQEPEQIKIEECETVTEEIINVETTPEKEIPAPPPQEQEPAIPEPEVVQPEPEVNISFPDVKFPTPEIKVIQQEEQKIKEEVKEPEPEVEPPAPEIEKEAEVPVPEVVEESTPTEQPEPVTEPPIVEPVVEETQPESNPAPSEQEAETVEGVEEVVEEPAVPDHPPTPPPAPSPPAPRPEVEPEPPAEEPTQEDNEDERSLEEIKKEVELEESTPLIQIEKQAQSETADAAETKTEGDADMYDAHTETDDDTPMELVREEEKDGKKKRDYSRKKKPDSRTCSGSESAAETSAPDSPSGADRQQRLWKKSLMLVYSRLCAHKYASLFLRPISDAEAPDYSVVVKRPMDLATVRKNIDSGAVKTTAEFQRDILLMLTNALMYNGSSHRVHHMAREMLREAETQISLLVAAQTASPPPARRRRRDQPRADQPPAKRQHSL
ncbi:bromodomain-containing protein 8 [Plutella xylostella]|uniref:bromodomain-containing protein 8 n=1 Tax=Plutella xylostella TaxID=51655 RepID=UPI0020321B3B|nr:bromodomain-containing protein 8 [Plutella xylostella]